MTHFVPCESVALDPHERTAFGVLVPERIDPFEMETVVAYDPPAPSLSRARVWPVSEPAPTPPRPQFNVMPQRFMPTRIGSLPEPSRLSPRVSNTRLWRLASVGLWTVAVLMFSAAMLTLA